MWQGGVNDSGCIHRHPETPYTTHSPKIRPEIAKALRDLAYSLKIKERVSTACEAHVFAYPNDSMLGNRLSVPVGLCKLTSCSGIF